MLLMILTSSHHWYRSGVRVLYMWFYKKVSRRRKTTYSITCYGTGLQDCFVPMATPFTLSSDMVAGLTHCHWPGRSQSIVLSNDTELYLDGAHTSESLEVWAIRFPYDPYNESGHATILMLNDYFIRILLLGLCRLVYKG